MARRSLVAVLGVLLLAPATANAATVAVEDGVLHVVGTVGVEWIVLDQQVNGGNITVSNIGGDYAVVAGAGCVQQSTRDAWCSPAGVQSALVDLGDGDDHFIYGDFAQPTRVEGGGGDDVLSDNEGVEEFYGGEGDDWLWMDSGEDEDPDVLYGGPGFDLASYGQGRGDSVGSQRLSIDDIANDGVPGEGDNIHTDIEALNGSHGDDVLIGSPGDNELYGNTGDDELYGRGGDDVLGGGYEYNREFRSDTDRLFGGDGFDVAEYSSHWEPVVVTLDGQANDGAESENDHVDADIEGATGGHGDDVLTGNTSDGLLVGLDGDDRIVDPGGADLLAGDEGDYGGDDEIEAADGGVDEVLCGDGEDSVWHDAADDVGWDCETATAGPRTPEPTPTPTPTATPTPTPTVTRAVTLIPRRPPRQITPPLDRTSPIATVLRVAARARAATLRRSGLSLTVRCSEACRASAELNRHRGTVASGARPGLSLQERRLRVRLTAAGKRALRPGRYQLTLTLTDRAGNKRTIVRSLRVT